ncbi:hypothetical protein PQ472_00935 [Lacticaseibacillus pabuli]|uniref:Uncharacterized protein n=1 Tax=Lacticaseibacillus pabuli TaxID=3025672 RepID=A0ABY7WV34_9LACO|nr:hypothetical protein [Lacticaseibacillus sp. KACC 23028]WDF82837.1 hypothetical protein PQ472_00935 [Lacticaseibacillus sp. KACC 23028]
MGLFNSKDADFTPDYKNHYLEFDSRKHLLRLRLGAFKKVVVPLADLRGYKLVQDGKELLSATAGKPLGLSQDEFLPRIIRVNQEEAGAELMEGDIYKLEVVVQTTKGDQTMKFIDTRTPIKSPAYTDAALDLQSVLARLDQALAAVEA